METDKIEEAKDECLVVVAKASAAILKGGPIPNITPAFDALIAAVREDEREQAVARVLVPSNRYSFFGNKMSGYDEGEYLRAQQTVEAIRNA